MRADLQQRTHDDTHHVIQKSVARNDEAHLVAAALNIYCIYPPHGGFFHALIRLERREIVLPKQNFRCALHRADVKLLAHTVHIPALENVLHLAVLHAVNVRFPDAAQPRVKPRRGKRQIICRDILRQRASQAR